MTLLVERPAVPWQLPAAQQLLEVLCEFYPDRDSVLAIARAVGLSPALLDAHKPPYFLWHDVLDKLAPRGTLRQLIERMIEDFPQSPRRAFLNELLTSEPDMVPVDARPPAKDGSRFIEGTGDVSRPESLLFHDDLSLKITRLPWLIAALERMSPLANAVCKLISTGPAGTQHATGFLIADGLVLTNWHVVEAEGARAYGVRALFGFDEDGADAPVSAVTAVDADLGTLVGEAADDWAVFRLAASPPDGAGTINLEGASDPRLGEAAFVIQHPGGETKRIAYARNTVTSFDDRVVHYLSDTRRGSSGSPVLNAEGKIIALHHAGGTPQQLPGKPPLVKNEGIRIGRVKEGLRQRGVACG